MKNLKIIAFLFLVTITCSCNVEEILNPTGPINLINEAPNAFSLVRANNGATNIDLSPNLSWNSAIDPDGDTVSYDLYLDTNQNPTTLLAANITATSFQIQNRLSTVQQYYWKVVAKDGRGKTTQSNAVFSFTTRNLNVRNITNNATFTERFKHSSAVFDNKLWVIGGRSSFANVSNNDKSDVWNSTNGINWTLVTSNSFSNRHNHTSLVFDNKLWVIGGEEDNRRLNDDLYYSSNGSTWQSALGPIGGGGPTATVLGNNLWSINGSEGDLQFYGIRYRTSIDDFWRSVPYGVYFPRRREHTTTTFDNKLIVVGGIGTTTNGIYNDVWHSTDGSIWRQAIGTVFPERFGHTATVFDNKIWIIGGRGYGGVYKNDIWYSTDGINWIEFSAVGSFPARAYHTAVVFDDKIWIIGGINGGGSKKDVWVID